MTGDAPTADTRAGRPPWRDRIVILWAGVVGYLLLAVTAPIGPRGWGGRPSLVLACIVAFFAIRAQAKDGARLGARDVPWVLGGGAMLVFVVRGVGWLIRASS